MSRLAVITTNIRVTSVSKQRGRNQIATRISGPRTNVEKKLMTATHV
jgi:hypothetical protein